MTSVPTLSFKCALITGGGGGLGKAMAQTLIGLEKEVILAGRTGAGLKKTATEIGAKAYFVLDISNISSIANFIAELRPFQILGPDYDFDLTKADQEIDTNIRGLMHLSVGLVPHFNSLENGGVIMNLSSVLGYNPVSLANPVYNATKAWVHFFTMNLRSQLRNAGSKIKVVEIVPPTLETSLHRERKDPNDNKKANGNDAALSIDEFTEQILDGWKSDKDTCRAGMGHESVDKWYSTYGEAYAKAGG